MAKRKVNNHRLYQKAKLYLVDGVDSPVRSFKYAGGEPVLIKEGRGSKVYDYDGNEYIDYVLSWGAQILGHSSPAVIKVLKEAAGRGLSFGTTNYSEIELAQLITGAIPFVEKIRFVNSGTEAVMGAVRLARGYTKRDKILKFTNSYHGHADYLLAEAGSGLATLLLPSSEGVPAEFIKHTLVAPLGDSGAVKKVFKKYGERIAAVIVEPVGGNYGVIPPARDFLIELRRITGEYKALLIFDEVITGFRFNFGSVSGQLGVSPDLICLGKIIGGGLPIGAYGGREHIMKHLAPSGGVYQASTFAGNPVVTAAGLAALRVLKGLKDRYTALGKLTGDLVYGLESQARAQDIGLKISHFGSMFSLKFEKKAYFRRFYRRMLERGIYLSPSEFESNFLSFSHSKSDIDRTLTSAKSALKGWASS